MAAYGTRYLGGPNKLYLVSLRIEKPWWTTPKEIETSLRDIIKKEYREDESYYFDDEDALKDIIDWVEQSDRYVYYQFRCDRETCVNLTKKRKYYGIQIERTGGRWI